MIWLFITGAVVLAMTKLGEPPKKENKERRPIPCYIEYKGGYWNGSKFANGKRGAIKFADEWDAWEYVDNHFKKNIAEECELGFDVKDITSSPIA